MADDTDPDGLEIDGPVYWRARAQTAEDGLSRMRDGIDRLIAEAFKLEMIAERLAATCADPAAVADYLKWKEMTDR